VVHLRFSVLVACGAASLGDECPMFCDSVVALSSRLKTQKMRSARCFEMSYDSHPVMQHHAVKEGNTQHELSSHTDDDL
jgi:hypothetical protein